MDSIYDIEIPIEDFLEHYGVKGMKWGVRRNRSGSGSGSRSVRVRRKLSPEQQASRLSDEQLKKAVDRLRMEQSYVQMKKSLNPPNPAKKLLNKVGDKSIEAASAAAATALVGLAITKVWPKIKGRAIDAATLFPTLGG